MTSPSQRRGAFFLVALAVLFFIRVDVWQWNDSGRLLGLPTGFTYHILFCFVLIGFFYAMVRWAWPYDDSRGGDA